MDQAFLDDLEARLIQADVGVAATGRIIDRVREAFADKTADEDLLDFVKGELKALLADPRPGDAGRRPHEADGLPDRRGQRLGQDDLDRQARPAAQGRGRTRSSWPPATPSAPRRPTSSASGPTAPAPTSSRAPPAPTRPAWPTTPATAPWPGSVDVLIVDTAGRLHTQTHLMRELEKVRSVLQRKIPGAPHEVLLVLDATNGQNAIRQAEVFTKSIGCTGVILTKLDGTAKGGVVVAVRQTIEPPRQVHRRRRGASTTSSRSTPTPSSSRSSLEPRPPKEGGKSMSSVIEAPVGMVEAVARPAATR